MLNAPRTGFQHYSFRHRITAWVSATLFDGITYTSRHGLTRGMKRRGGLGWLPISPAKTPEERFWETLDLRDAVVYDVGAFHGLLTLHFARSSKHVVSFEPTAENRARLEQNIALNRLTNVTVRPVGLGSAKEMRLIRYDSLVPGGATVDFGEPIKERRSLDYGYTHHGVISAFNTQPVKITTIDQDMAEYSLPVPSFVKIDVEGFELQVLKGAKELLSAHHPKLFLEMHGATLSEKERKVAEIVAHLSDLGYSITHVETGSRITTGNSIVARQGHLYCTNAG